MAEHEIVLAEAAPGTRIIYGWNPDKRPQIGIVQFRNGGVVNVRVVRFGKLFNIEMCEGRRVELAGPLKPRVPLPEIDYTSYRRKGLHTLVPGVR